MVDYTKYKRGSEWRKWDLHIHTPETKKNDQFEGSTPDEKWEKFIDSINESLEEISVIGITDYFCIDNYFKFKNFIEEGKITKSFDLVLPNVEIRVTPVTGSSTPINLHCIFNPIIENEIETRFLSKLNFNYSGSDYSAKKEELIRLGKSLPGNNSIDDISAFKFGLDQYIISIDTLRKVFEKDIKLRENTIIVVSNKSPDGVTGIIKHSDFFISPNQSQMDATRWSIYQFSDAIFSSNEGDILYFIGLGADEKKTVIEKCKMLMPCFHGCDAHDNEHVFKPSQNRFCWIKADPTFEGFKQTIYEPEERVKIQALKPDMKNERFIISKLQFIDASNIFGNQEIHLNENLNTIIGGKSSGKSLLLYSTANSIDPEQVERTSKKLGFEGYTFDQAFNFQVTWKDKDNDLYIENDVSKKLHKTTYIPQLYINHLVEKNNNKDLNILILNILLQDITFKNFYEDKSNLIVDFSIEIDRLLNEYLLVRKKALSVHQKSKDTGNSENIKKAINNIGKEIFKSQKSSTLSDEEFKEYNFLLSKKNENDSELRSIDEEEIVLFHILAEIKVAAIKLIGGDDKTTNEFEKGELDRIVDECEYIPTEILTIKENFDRDFRTIISNLEKEIDELDLKERKTMLNKKIKNNTDSLKPYLLKISGQKELQKLTLQLESETINYHNSLEFEKQLRAMTDEYTSIRLKISNLLKRRFESYQEIEKEVNNSKKNISSDIELKCTLGYKLENFTLFEQVNKASIRSDHFFYSLFKDEFIHYNLIPNFFKNQLKVIDDKLYYDNEKYIPLKIRTTLDEVLRGLIKDSFELNYSVTYKGDNLLRMSPGKKGTVLLILFLQISSSEVPILIDQPEDNLDNRTIYDLLCKIIKEKKKDRQIIIVSHNANLVVATDAENIIIANQQGEETEMIPGRCKFEYVNGSLEHSFSKEDDEESILLSQGIREHVCDLLEGGGEAFKQRERKYSIK